jgi:RNA polymerase sigma-70 factor (ECF subfamily)
LLSYLQMAESEDDKTKFEQIYLTYRGLMFYVANQILHNEQDAEDCVHQAFLSILGNLKNISEVRCPKTRSYVVIIVERKSLDLLRKTKHEMLTEITETFRGVEIPLPGENGLADAITALPADY